MDLPGHSMSGGFGFNQSPEYPAYTQHNDIDETWTQTDAASLLSAEPTTPPLQPLIQSPPPEFTLSPPCPHPPSRYRKTRSHKVSQRGPSYTRAEDKALCSAYLNVSRDPIIGANQTSSTYWERISQYYHDNNSFPTHRSLESLQHRWGTISKDTARFCSFKAEQDRRQESGKTEDNRIDDALKQFQGQVGKPFLFLHCWNALKNTRKWQDWISGKVDDAEEDSAAGETPRPIGRDAAKKRRNDAVCSSSSSACLEIFQKMAMNREAKTQQEAVWAAEHREAQQRQLALQEEQTRIQREQWDWAKFQDENKIMLMDLSNCTDYAREYFLSLQQEILQKRLKGASTSGQK